MLQLKQASITQISLIRLIYTYLTRKLEWNVNIKKIFCCHQTPQFTFVESNELRSAGGARQAQEIKTTVSFVPDTSLIVDRY